MTERNLSSRTLRARDSAHCAEFAAEVAALETRLTQQRDVAVARLRAVHEAWARALLSIDDADNLVASVRAAVENGIDPCLAAEAIEQLRAAESHQWEIGTWATGAGEGRASMGEVRALQIAQAWLWATQPSESGAVRARELLRQAAEDPNHVAARYGKHIDALYIRLR